MSNYNSYNMTFVNNTDQELVLPDIGLANSYQESTLGNAFHNVIHSEVVQDDVNLWDSSIHQSDCPPQSAAEFFSDNYNL